MTDAVMALLLNSGAAVLAGLAIGMLVYTIITWGHVPVRQEQQEPRPEEPWRHEPLYIRLWWLLKRVVSGRALSSILGSFSLFEPVRVEEIIRQAGFPWGMRTASDCYASGVVFGGVFFAAITYLAGFNPVLVATIPLFLMIGVSAMVGLLKLVALNRHQQMVRELWTLLTGLELYMQAGFPLYFALKEAAATCAMIAPVVDRSLMLWSSVSPRAALDQLGKELNLPEAFLVVSVLRQALDIDPASVAVFISREAARLDKMLEAQQSQSAQLKPMFQNAVMMIPMFNLFMLWTAPMAYSIFLQMSSGLSGISF